MIFNLYFPSRNKFYSLNSNHFIYNKRLLTFMKLRNKVWSKHLVKPNQVPTSAHPQWASIRDIPYRDASVAPSDTKCQQAPLSNASVAMVWKNSFYQANGHCPVLHQHPWVPLKLADSLGGQLQILGGWCVFSTEFPNPNSLGSGSEVALTWMPCLLAWPIQILPTAHLQAQQLFPKYTPGGPAFNRNSICWQMINVLQQKQPNPPW